MADLTREVLLALRAPYSRQGVSSSTSAPGRGVTHVTSSSSSSGVSEVPMSSAARRSASFDVPLTAPIIGSSSSSSSSSSARPTRDHRPDSASDYPIPPAASAASISPNPAAAVSLIPLLLLESASTKKSAAALKRDAEQMLQRVEAHVTRLFPAGPQKVAVVKSSAYAPGMIIGMRP